ncbi:hypothetical protein [Vulcanisaeta thermophila]|uniref:hypothetical protein n=1 Tax=Vulcanisaeta thermophila TaxID=867917 RepID=UPI0008535E50|nr:hypothetical protein [Vulcanisaeta thermophila]
MRRLMKIVYFELKQRTNRAFLVVVIFVLALYSALTMMIPQIPPTLVVASLTPVIIILIIASALSSTLALFVRSAVDYVFTTPINPMDYYIATLIANGLPYALLIIVLGGALLIKLGLHSILNVINAASIIIFLVVITANLSVLSRRVQVPAFIALILIFVLGYVNPALSPLYGLISPDPVYTAYSLSLLAVSLLTVPRRYIRELGTNAYGLLITSPLAIRHGSVDVVISELPRTPWGIIWFTSTRSLMLRLNTPQGAMTVVRRTNVLVILMPLSVFTAVAYTVASMLITGVMNQTALSIISFFMISFYALIFSSQSIANERLWLNLSIEPTRYFRYRMGARVLMTTLAFAPWIVAYVVQGVLRFEPAIYLAPSLLSGALTIPVISWLAAAYLGIPQVREVGVAERQLVYTHRALVLVFMFIAGSYLYALPYYIALASVFVKSVWITLMSDAFSVIMVALSALFLHYVLSPRGGAVWLWLVNRLSENGYV